MNFEYASHCIQKFSLELIPRWGPDVHECMLSLFLNVICRILTNEIECAARKEFKSEKDLQSSRSFKSLLSDLKVT